MTKDWHQQISVHPIGRIAALAPYGNGQLPDSALTAVADGNGKPMGSLEHTAARAWTAMVAAAKASAVVLGGRSTYRTLSTQIDLLHQRYDHADHGKGHIRYAGQDWYLKPGNATVATPGTSNHGWGRAIDDNDTSYATGLGWLEDNAQRFGFQWEVPSEAWHLQYWAGDAVPQAVLDYEHGHVAPTPPIQQEEDMLVIKVTAGDDHGKIFYVVPGSYLEIDQSSADHLTHDGIRYQTMDDISWAQTKRQLTPSK